MKYRDNMAAWEVEKLMREVENLDKLYEDAAQYDAHNLEKWLAQYGAPTEEEMEEYWADFTMRHAALNCGRP